MTNDHRGKVADQRQAGSNLPGSLRMRTHVPRFGMARPAAPADAVQGVYAEPEAHVTDWVRDDSGLSIREIEARGAYKMHPHAFVARRRLPWPACKHCGLLRLRNQLTEWVERMGCNAEDHPGYAARVKASVPR